MQDGIRRIVGNDAEQRLVAGIKPQDRDQPVDHAEDLEEDSRCLFADRSGDDRHDSGGEMNEVMRCVDIEQAEQFSPRVCRGNPTKHADDDKDDTENDGNLFE